jgi:hypothetical protein
MNKVFSIRNESARVFLTSALWCPADQQLVAAVMVSDTYEVFRAIWATLATNSGKALTLVCPGQYRWLENKVALKGARQGFTTVNAPRSTAAIYTAALLHPRAGDPASLPPPAKKDGVEVKPYCYVVGQTGEDLVAKFEQRLGVALPWPTQPSWADYLLTTGREAKLVSELSAGVSEIFETASSEDEDDAELIAPDCPEFAAGLRVTIDPIGWREVIDAGLHSGALSAAT